MRVYRTTLLETQQVQSLSWTPPPVVPAGVNGPSAIWRRLGATLQSEDPSFSSSSSPIVIPTGVNGPAVIWRTLRPIQPLYPYYVDPTVPVAPPVVPPVVEPPKVHSAPTARPVRIGVRFQVYPDTLDAGEIGHGGRCPDTLSTRPRRKRRFRR